MTEDDEYAAIVNSISDGSDSEDHFAEPTAKKSKAPKTSVTPKNQSQRQRTIHDFFGPGPSTSRKITPKMTNSDKSRNRSSGGKRPFNPNIVTTEVTHEEAERLLKNLNRRAPCIVEEVDIKDVGDEPCFVERNLLKSAERHMQRTANILSNRHFLPKKPAVPQRRSDSPKKTETPTRNSDCPKPSTSGLQRLHLKNTPNILSNRTKPLSSLSISSKAAVSHRRSDSPKMSEKETPKREEAKSESPKLLRKSKSPEPSLDDDLMAEIMATAEPVDTPTMPESPAASSSREIELLETSVESLHLESVNYALAPDLRKRQQNDYVLIDLSSIEHGKIPKPCPDVRTDAAYGWGDHKYVRMPFSSARITKSGDSAANLLRQYLRLLTEPKMTIDDVGAVIDMYRARPMNYDSLYSLFNNHLTPEKRLHYLNFVIPEMAKLALRMDELFTQALPRLRAGVSCSLTMSQEQVACLLAHAFFCTYPTPAANYADLMHFFNFNSLLMRGHRTKIEKLKCILHYFDCVTRKIPNGVISIRRHVVTDNVRFSTRIEPICNLRVHEDGRIEDTNNEMLEIDFANKYIGGGVLNEGCVQEEIRFMLSPELLVSLLVCEKMEENESISIVGTQRFSDYKGYADSFRYVERAHEGSVIRDRFNRILSEVVAIDAILFYKNPIRQFEDKNIFRELKKAYTGFDNLDDLNRPIATGNWGCGAFRGDRQLKSLIQLIAASACGRSEMHYFTFDDAGFSRKLEQVHRALTDSRTSIGSLLKLIIAFRDEEAEAQTRFPLFDYIIREVSRSREEEAMEV